MRNAWNFLYADFGILIPALIITALGGWLFANQKGSILKAVVGSLLFAVGGLAALSAFYIDGFRWLNVVGGIILVIYIGFSLVRNAPGIVTTLIGAMVIVVGLFALSDSRPLNQLDYQNGSFGAAFNAGWDRLVTIFDGDNGKQKNGQKPDRQNGGADAEGGR